MRIMATVALSSALIIVHLLLLFAVEVVLNVRHHLIYLIDEDISG